MAVYLLVCLLLLISFIILLYNIHDYGFEFYHIIIGFIILVVFLISTGLYCQPYKDKITTTFPVTYINDSAYIDLDGKIINLNEKCKCNFDENEEITLNKYPMMWSGYMFRPSKYEIIKKDKIIYTTYGDQL